MDGPVLVTGAGGQLGRAVLRLITERDHVALDRGQLDLTDRSAVRSAFAAYKPSAVVNCAAMTDVDGCETNLDGAYAVNAWAVRNVAEAADAVGAYVCHVSTDYVFDGTKGSPYTEWDAPSPGSVYGASKLAGERELRPGSGVARTAWLAGFDGSNIVKTILRLAGEGQHLTFVDDQIGTPALADDVAVRLVAMIDDRLPGVFHTVNTGSTSWYGYAADVLDFAGYDRSQVAPIATADLTPARPAARPADSRLDSPASTLAGLDPLPDYRESLERLVRSLTR